MKFCPRKGEKLLNVVMHNVIKANQKTESCFCHWLHAHAVVDVTCFPAFVGASDVISSVLLIL